MTNAEAQTAAHVAIVCGVCVGIGGGLVSASRLPWYSAIGAGILAFIVTFLVVAVLFSIEVPK